MWLHRLAQGSDQGYQSGILIWVQSSHLLFSSRRILLFFIFISSSQKLQLCGKHFFSPFNWIFIKSYVSSFQKSWAEIRANNSISFPAASFSWFCALRTFCKMMKKINRCISSLQAEYRPGKRKMKPSAKIYLEYTHRFQENKYIKGYVHPHWLRVFMWRIQSFPIEAMKPCIY